MPSKTLRVTSTRKRAEIRRAHLEMVLKLKVAQL